MHVQKMQTLLYQFFKYCIIKLYMLMKWRYVTQSPCANISKLCISYPAKNELHCFSNSLHSESAVAKILPPYILQMDQFYYMEAKCNFEPPSAKIPNSVFNFVLNLRGRGWVEHTQMHLALKKGTKHSYYTSNSWGIFSEFTFSLDKNPNNWYEGTAIP
jgi:hypothetical protein